MLFGEKLKSFRGQMQCRSSVFATLCITILTYRLRIQSTVH